MSAKFRQPTCCPTYASEQHLDNCPLGDEPTPIGLEIRNILLAGKKGSRYAHDE